MNRTRQYHLNLFIDLVQLPEPVKNIITKPSNFSVHLSWAIPGPKTSSYITHFIIYLNDKELLTISRKRHGNQFDLTGLKPYTEYTVGIETEDSSLRKSKKTSVAFKTTEAGKLLK